MMRLLFCISFLLVASCGQGDFPDYNNTDTEQREEQQSGNFVGNFTALNPALTGSVVGKIQLWIKGIQFYSKVVLLRGVSRTRHEQYIHSGGNCPTASDDIDGDGTLGLSEVIRVSGTKLIPLDGILKTQLEGLGLFPSSNRKGRYTYSRSTSIFNMMEDLRAPDFSPNDFMEKLPWHENLDLDQRTLILYVHLNNKLTPVACAEIEESFDF